MSQEPISGRQGPAIPPQTAVVEENETKPATPNRLGHRHVSGADVSTDLNQDDNNNRLVLKPPLQGRTLSVEPTNLTEPVMFTIGDDSWKLRHYELKLDAVRQALQEQPAFEELISMKLNSPGNSPLFQKFLLPMVAEIRDGEESPTVSTRERYKNFLSQFRESYAEISKGDRDAEPFSSGRKLLRLVGRALFTSKIEGDFHSELVQSVRQKAASDAGKSLPLSLASRRGSDLSNRLVHTQKLISKQHSSLENARNKREHVLNVLGGLAAGESGINYDPYRQGNIPDVLFRPIISGKEVSCIRMGTPTWQELPTNANVTPEFQCFLESLQDSQPNEHHLYINRQKRNRVEGVRSHALESLQDQPDLEKQVTVVTLPADSDFYNQKKKFSKNCTLPTLRQDIINFMKNNQHGFFLPKKLKAQISNKSKISIEDFLGAHVDEAAKEAGIPLDKILNQQERRAFIFHFLNKTLVEALINVVGANTYNHTCKDDIDRGGVANAYFFAVKNRPEETADSDALEVFAKEVEAKVNAPALEVKKREVIEHRHEDLQNTLKTLAYWER